MPTYGYKCTQCNHTFEVFQRITDEPVRECEKCKGEVRKLLFPVGIVFKGSGFHINDYRKDKGNGNGSDHKESKPEPKSEAKEAKPAKETAKSS